MKRWLVSELPAGWSHIQLGEIIELRYGKALPATERDGGAYPVYGSNGIIGYHSAHRTQGPTIIVGRKGSVGEVCYSPMPCSPIDTTYYIDSFETVEPKFLYYLLRFLDLHLLNRSTAIPGLNRQDAYGVSVPMPPLAEQHRIAQTLDTLQAQIDALKARVNAIPTLVERMRKSVLASAMIGSVAAFSPPLVSSTRSRTKLTLGDETLDVPAGWGSASLGSLLDSDRKLCYGVVQPGLEVESGIEMVRVCDIDGGKIAWDSVRKIASDVDNEYRRSRIARGDILLSIVGSIGRAAIVRKDSSANIARAVARLSVDPSRLTPEWLFLWLTCPSVQWWLASSSKEVARKTLNLKELSELPVLLPTIAEQTEIVRRVEQLFAIADQLEAKVSAAKQRIDSLTQSLLAKAFRGELVPQDPNDEPASVLLERIRAQRAAVPKPKRGRKAASN